MRLIRDAKLSVNVVCFRTIVYNFVHGSRLLEALPGPLENMCLISRCTHIYDRLTTYMAVKFDSYLSAKPMILSNYQCQQLIQVFLCKNFNFNLLKKSGMAVYTEANLQRQVTFLNRFGYVTTIKKATIKVGTCPTFLRSKVNNYH